MRVIRTKPVGQLERPSGFFVYSPIRSCRDESAVPTAGNDSLDYETYHPFP
jgi:hypothetical protein